MTEEIIEEKVKFKFTSDFIISQLELYHTPDEWAFFVELRLGTGYGKDSEQRFDAWAIHYLKGKRNVSRCYEIKVSRSDFQSELKKPLKRRAGLRLSNEFYFVCPKGMVKVEEVPVECGLIEVDERGTLETVIEAPFRDTWPCTWQFMAVICKRLDTARRMEYEAEQKIKGIVYEREGIARTALERHLEKWRNHKIGSREIPDHILAAMEDLALDVEESFKLNRKYK